MERQYLTPKDVFNCFQSNGLFSENEKEHNEFSATRCEVCNGLAGERFSITGYINLDEAKYIGNLYSLDICIDCFGKLYNAD